MTIDTAPKNCSNTLSVCLFGDSVLDNSIWLRNPRRSVVVQLREVLRAEARDGEHISVTDFSVDALKLSDMNTGPPNHLTKDYFAMHRYILDLPAYNLLESYDSVPVHDVAVLSIGGNDALSFLKNKPPQVGDVLEVFKKRLGNHLHIVASRLLTKCKHLILLVPYLPFYSEILYKYALGVDLHKKAGRRLLASMASVFYDTQTVLGSKYVSVLDLMCSVDFSNLTNYASTPIEPSEEASQRMCNRLARMCLGVRHHHLRRARCAVAPGARQQLIERYIDNVHRRIKRRGKRSCLSNSALQFLLGGRLITNIYILSVRAGTVLCKLLCCNEIIEAKVDIFGQERERNILYDSQYTQSSALPKG